jgi:hypothetical protein
MSARKQISIPAKTDQSGSGPLRSLTAPSNARRFFQAKLANGLAHDPMESEADRVADQVIHAPANRAESPRIHPFRTQTSEQAREVPGSVDRVLAHPGTPLEPALQQDMEHRFVHDFSQVRVHTDTAAGHSARDVSAHAYTVGRDIVFGAGQFAPQTQTGRRLLAHELTHFVQQSAVNQSMSALGPGLQRKPAPPKPDLEFALILSAGKTLTDADARRALDFYKKLTTAEREKAFKAFYPSGEITELLRALKAADAAGPYVSEVGQILRWVEEAETRKASGKTDDQMADVQAKFKLAEAQKEAQAKIAAKTPKHVAPPPPTPKEVEEARKEKVEQTSIAPTTVTTWDKKTKVEKDAWKKRGKAVIKSVVALAAKNFPELKLAESHFLADFGGVEGRGQRVLAYGQADGKGGTLAVFGFRFVEAAEANPAYVMSVVVHEVFGHPQYGAYGSEYHLALYDASQAKMPGYKKPAAGTQERRSEIDAYAYQETEIYSLLRSLPYHTSIAPADAGKGLVSIDPTATVEARIGLMKQQWEPTLVVALLRGLFQRLLQDPRITGPALNAFKAGVTAKFPAESKTILK